MDLVKAKYPVSAHSSTPRASWTWKAVWNLGHLIWEHLLKHVGNGKSTPFGLEPWVFPFPLSYLPMEVDVILVDNSLVSDFIYEDSMTWNYDN